MTDQTERRDDVDHARAIGRIGHLIESGYLPRDLADDLQQLIKLAEENSKLGKIVSELSLEKAMRGT